MAVNITKCTQHEPCFLNKTNVAKLYEMSCLLNQLKHKLECCAVRMEGYDDSPCHGPGDLEVSGDQMGKLLTSLETTAADMRRGIQKHEELHLKRVKKPGAVARDSGYLSGVPDNCPVQEETAAGNVSSTDEPVSSTREAEEHSESMA